MSRKKFVRYLIFKVGWWVGVAKSEIFEREQSDREKIERLVATYSINFLKIPVEQVSFVLGHTNITTTQRYIANDISLSKSITEMIVKSV